MPTLQTMRRLDTYTNGEKIESIEPKTDDDCPVKKKK